MDRTLNPVKKKKPRAKFGRRKQRKRKLLHRGRKPDFVPLLERGEEEEDVDSSQQQQRDHLHQENQERLDVHNNGGDDSSSTTTSRPLKPSSSSSTSMLETVVTSRSKRLRAATSTQIAYTDRKTRSTSSSSSSQITNLLLSNILETFGEESFSATTTTTPADERIVIKIGENASEIPSIPIRKVHSNGESRKEGNEDDGYDDETSQDPAFLPETNGCDDTFENENSIGDNLVVVARTDDESGGGGNGTRSGDVIVENNNKSMKSELKEDEEETDEASIIQPSVDQGEKGKEKITGLDVRNKHGPEHVSRKRVTKNNQSESGFRVNTGIVLQQNVPHSGGPLLGKGSEFTSSSGQHLQKFPPPTKLVHGGSGGGGGGKKLKLTDDRKLTTLAPMLLMNNLPYMGELTFDTRPRRGRKPKKADICHLISKNYGIHFPNSYTNTPYTGPPEVVATTLSAQKGGSLMGKSVGLPSKSTSGKHSFKKSKGSSGVSSCPQTWNIVPSTPPALLPLTPTAGSTASRHKSRLASPSSSSFLTRPPSSSSKSSGNKSGNTNGKCFESQNSNAARSSYYGTLGAFEEPLNLCVRDASSSSLKSFQLQNQFNLNSLSSKNCSEMMNLKLPLLASNLFSDFQLKPVSCSPDKGTHEIVSSRKGSKGVEVGSKKFKSNNSNATTNSFVNIDGGIGGENNNAIRDSGLVNQLNFQLNLAKCAQLSSSEPSSSSPFRNKSSRGDSFGFILPNNSGIPQVQTTKCGSKKTRRIRGGGSSSSHLGLNKQQQMGGDAPMTAEPPSSAGGSLFGQTDSGSSSGAQVSICKFKFTGGAKPSLQEKKMLSVDSGGNFRFYTDKDKVGGSSTVKSAKAQSILSSSSTSGDGESRTERETNQGCHYAYSALPKSAKSMSVCMPVRPSSLKPSSTSQQVVVESSSAGSSSKIPSSTATHGISSSSSSAGFSIQQQQQGSGITPSVQDLNNLLDIHGRLAFPSSSSSMSQFPIGGEDGYSSSQSSESGGGGGVPSGSHASLNGGGAATPFELDAYKTSRKLLRLKRKRRTRKSLMREKLEKTFKEKGFLIQTQQLESAEGATYCKFRQLRKFTRYLFRSWRDYLPDNVKDINNSNNCGSGGGQVQDSSGGASGSVNPTATTTSGSVLLLLNVDLTSLN